MINFLLTPEWQVRRAVIMDALKDYPEAKQVVEELLAPLEQEAANQVGQALTKGMIDMLPHKDNWQVN